MDFETQGEQSPDAAAAARARDAARAAQTKDDATSMSGPANGQDKQDSGKPKENAGPRVPPIPSSALVILPPAMRRFDAKDAAAEPKDGRAGQAKWLRYGSRAALVLILCGAAFAAGGHFFGSTPPAEHAADLATASWQAAKDDSNTTDVRHATAALSEEVHGIETRLDSLRAAAQTPEEIRALKKSIDGLKASFEAEKAEADASIAQLSAKLDQLQREPGKLTQASFEKGQLAESNPAMEKTVDPKAIQATLDKAARTEKSDPMTTASIPATSAAQSAGAASQAGSPKAQALPTASAEPQKKPPQLLPDWQVRDVYDGIALVEGPQGAIEVMPGDTIPGAGTVKSIERRAGGWIVVTSRGMMDYARD
jgi:hypothetical protein